jgi:hypothetical protein
MIFILSLFLQFTINIMTRTFVHSLLNYKIINNIIYKFIATNNFLNSYDLANKFYNI